MKVLTWNIRRATEESTDVWSEVQTLNPDVALLQEVGGVPEVLLKSHRYFGFRAENKGGGKQAFETGILVRKGECIPVRLTSADPVLQHALEAYAGNLVHVRWTDESRSVWNLLSVYSPAWPLFSFQKSIPKKYRRFKSELSKDLWLTDLVHRYLHEHMNGERWIVAGDFNSATTFSWEIGQNQEFIDNMEAAGLTDAIFLKYGGPVPTFRHSRGSVLHQLDHFYLSEAARDQLLDCQVLGDHGVFERRLSDHLPILVTWKKSE